MYCMNCGKEIEDNVKECEFSGASQETKKNTGSSKGEVGKDG